MTRTLTLAQTPRSRGSTVARYQINNPLKGDHPLHESCAWVTHASFQLYDSHAHVHTAYDSFRHSLLQPMQHPEEALVIRLSRCSHMSSSVLVYMHQCPSQFGSINYLALQPSRHYISRCSTFFRPQPSRLRSQHFANQRHQRRQSTFLLVPRLVLNQVPVLNQASSPTRLAQRVPSAASRFLQTMYP